MAEAKKPAAKAEKKNVEQVLISKGFKTEVWDGPEDTVYVRASSKTNTRLVQFDKAAFKDGDNAASMLDSLSE